MRAAPATIGGMPRSSKRASERQSATFSRSPCTTWIAIAVWPSLNVVNSCARATGIVELRGTIFSASPPIVSSPSDSGITSSSSQSSSRSRLPASTLAWIAAPSATTSSGLRLVSGGWPKNSATARADLRHPRRAADQHDALDVGGREPGVAQRALDRPQRLRDEVRGDLGERRRRQRRARPSSPSDSVAMIGADVVQRQVLLRLARLHQQQPRVRGRQRRQLRRLDASSRTRDDRSRRRPAPSRRSSPALRTRRATSLQDRDVERAAAQVVDGVRCLRPRCRGRRRSPPPSARSAGAARSSPASCAASLVACRCASSKYAGTVTTAPVERARRGSPRRASRSARRISAEISTGLFTPARVAMLHHARRRRRSGTESAASSARSARPRPINRLTETIVFCGSRACMRHRRVADLDAVSP